MGKESAICVKIRQKKMREALRTASGGRLVDDPEG
jgi:hypothetical protein